jgi:hypothetical protein
MISLILVLALGGVGLVAYKFLSAKSSDDDNEVVQTPQETSAEEKQREFDALIEAKQTNLIGVAKTVSQCKYMKDAASDASVKLIDAIWEILEPLNTRYPSMDVTYRINRMASGHLTEIFEDFSKVESPSDSHHNNLIQLIEQMQKGVDLASEALEADDVAKFNATASFLESMHGKQA